MKKLENQFRNEISNIYKNHLVALGDHKPDNVGYRDFKKDGTSLTYCSSDSWYASNIELEHEIMHYAKELLSIKREGFTFIIRSPSTSNTPFLRELYIRDMCNSILVYKIEGDIIHMFAFIFSSSNLSTMNFFINNREFFEDIASNAQADIRLICNKPEYSILRKQFFSKKTVDAIFSQVITKLEISGSFTSRQKECLILLQKGATHKDIAKQLGVCTKTVEYHISKIRNKLNCHSRFEISSKFKQLIV